MVGLVVAALALSVWLYLMVGRGAFWRAYVRDQTVPNAEPKLWPRVAAVVPARNEADVINKSIGSLLTQDYPGSFDVILVDDQSADGTAERAGAAATGMQAQNQLMMVPGRALPGGWTGKVWAMKQGIDHSDRLQPPPDYVLFMDADIACAPDALRRVVARAETDGLVLTSLMAKLRCETLAERALIPAFVFFFQMLYPFAWVNRRDCKMAAAAGGCMLVRRDALRQAGEIDAIRNMIIDDCALARKLKTVGRIWLGLTDRVRSLRPYPHVAHVRRMVSRSAYGQLRYSPILLAATIAAMTITYLAPPFFALFGAGPSQALAASAWGLMAVTFQPTLRFYRVSPLWGIALPAIAFAYMIFTLDSAYQHLRGRGGLWKGRIQANISDTR